MTLDFLLSKDLVDFQIILQQYFSEEIRSSLLRERFIENGAGELIERTTFDEVENKHWLKLAELGALLAAVPEGCSGLGMGALSAEVVISAAASSLVPLPIFETIALGVLPLAALESSEAAQQILRRVAEESLMLSGAFEELMEDSLNAVATQDASGQCSGQWKVCGKYRSVPNASRVAGLLVPARTAGGLGMFFLEPAKLSGNFKRQRSLDLLRPLYELELVDVPLSFLGEMSAVAVSKCKNSIAVCAAAELVGLGSRVLGMTVEYVKTRQQFGKAIGSFQAIQHKLADMCVQQETASALTRFAAWTLDSDPRQEAQACSASKAYVSEVIPKLIESAIQAHGGIGFTYEYDLHLYLRRAKTLASSFGGRDQHYQEVAKLF